MSYDVWLIPAESCESADAAREFAIGQDESRSTPTAVAERLAADISAANAPLDEESGFLSLFPLEASGAAVFVPSPFPRIQVARDVVVPQAFSAGYGVYDPQLHVVLDPRTAVAGTTMTSTEGTFPTITPGLIEFFVRAMQSDDFVIIETGAEQYMQTKRVDADEFLLEYRAGSAECHFGTTVATAADVAEAMRGWIAGNDAAYQRHSWERIDLG
ncbi:hypothetical protein HH308_17245 [Gordonia sp. TBRC 11910]|uniref:Uncharacterized protein n=1 Tax=Gordonia asplenii TaxID=2725283 RepID=A0A848KWI0_9ACTN|nr:hypothetical protein [Gordonia asplenii]NMO02960.1 hypothetical protein [Gordonia asplenii]